MSTVHASRGALCPECHRFSRACVRKYFPAGERTALKQWTRQQIDELIPVSREDNGVLTFALAWTIPALGVLLILYPTGQMTGSVC
jgi:hypothetical protein